ncbi:MAG: hypothetical protein JKY19_05460 [Alcanivoracaceae bacterium]|nr:hypothetical protein [Alcanivoracaceae bacterium]
MNTFFSISAVLATLVSTISLANEDDSRKPNGKNSMREGMSRYLGVHTGYEANLIEYIVGYNLIALKHKFSARGLRSDGSEFSYSKVVLDVIEIENGKISVIRRYGK